MSDFTKLAKEVVKIIQEDGSKKPVPADKRGVVKRIDAAAGKAYVHFDGGVDETPVDLTIDCKKGDNVQIRAANGKAWIVGNKTAPPTDDTTAIGARTVAIKAQDTADIALADAERAKFAADSAEENAIRASDAADTADKKAGEASGYAQDAMSSANSALLNLSQVEKVVDSLNWITEHGAYLHTKEEFSQNKIYYQVENAVYSASTDTEVNPNKDYYTENSGVYTWVSEPTGDPSASGYYEMTSGEFDQVDGTLVTYFHTTDEKIDDSKTYYIPDGSGGYEVVENPVQEDINLYYESTTQTLPRAEDVNTYYELTVDSAISNYVASHLALKDDGLHLQQDGTLAKVQLSSEEGLILYGADGNKVATYGEEISIGNEEGFHITINANEGENEGIIFWQNETKVAYINSNVLTIPKSLMLDSMQVGNWEWKNNNNNLTLTYIGS